MTQNPSNPHRNAGMDDAGMVDERFEDMLIEAALWGADAAGDTAGTDNPYEHAVAAAALAMLDDHDPLPEDIGAVLRAVGRGYAGGVEPAAGETRSAVAATEEGAAGVTAVDVRRVKPNRVDSEAETTAGPSVVGRIGPLAVGGWVAAAACLLIVVMLALPESPPSPAERLAELERGAMDLVRAPWAGLSAIGAPNHALDRGVGGEVIWSDDRDEGYMRISGIEPNDPGEYQYQLWIFDAKRRVGDLPRFAAEGLPEILTQRPVDGGVFDVTGSGEVIVPIDAKLPVGEGVVFAVTREKPGGVVVSDRDIVFLALKS